MILWSITRKPGRGAAIHAVHVVLVAGVPRGRYVRVRTVKSTARAAERLVWAVRAVMPVARGRDVVEEGGERFRMGRGYQFLQQLSDGLQGLQFSLTRVMWLIYD